MVATPTCGLAPLKEVPRLDRFSQTQLLRYFESTWALEDLLWQSLISEDTFYLNPDPLRNRLIFYLGHSAVFYINKLVRVGLLEQRINPTYETLFEIGVDPATPEELQAVMQNVQWPAVEAVWRYRSQARSVITDVIQRTPLHLPLHPQHPLWALLMGIEHSCIHFETSSMLIRQIPIDRLQRPQNWRYATTYSSSSSPVNHMIPIPGGTVTLGKPAHDQAYGWDSDYGSLPVTVQAFSCSQFLITNREFLEFVEAGGYDQPAYWTESAWDWKQQYQVQHPKFWRSRPQSGYAYRAMFDEIDLPLDWPVEVNHYEATAFCRWKGNGTRLLTEAEWHQVLNRQQVSETSYLDRSDLSTADSFNLNFQRGSPSPVGSCEASDEPNHVYDLRGNLWEWLADEFTSFPGFEPHPLYENYSDPFFDDRHYLMMGSSWASTGSYTSPYCRNWFRPYFYQHVGFRIAQDVIDR